MGTLYEFTTDYLQAFEAVEVNAETGEVMGLEALEAVNAKLEDKMEAIACYIKDRERLIGDIKAEEAALAERRRVIENKAAHLKEYLAQNMELAGKKILETAKCKVSFRRSSKVEIIEELLPKAYWVVTETKRPDKAALKKLLGQGVEVPGAKLLESRNLTIK